MRPPRPERRGERRHSPCRGLQGRKPPAEVRRVLPEGAARSLVAFGSFSPRTLPSIWRARAPPAAEAPRRELRRIGGELVLEGLFPLQEGVVRAAAFRQRDLLRSLRSLAIQPRERVGARFEVVPLVDLGVERVPERVQKPGRELQGVLQAREPVRRRGGLGERGHDLEIFVLPARLSAASSATFSQSATFSSWTQSPCEASSSARGPPGSRRGARVWRLSPLGFSPAIGASSAVRLKRG